MDQTLRILLLEDLAADAELIQSELHKADIAHVTRRVETNSDFLNALKEFAPDAILAEVRLPQFSGLQALRLLQAQDSDLPFILVTAAESEDAAVECLREGADDHILKSSLGRLPSALLNALKKKAAERVRERAVAEAEIRKLAAFPRFNPNPVLSFEADGSLSYFNHATLQMAKDLGKEHASEILPLNTSNIVKICLQTGASKLALEMRVQDRTLSWSFFPIVPAQVVHAYAEDITARLDLENQLRQSHKLESVGQLAAGVAHDFNNLLTIIQGHVGLLLSDRKVESEVTESLKQIALASARAANLTRQLLAFSRKQIMQPQFLRLNEVVANVAKMINPLLGEHITVKYNFGVNLPVIYSDPGMLQQIMVNLSVNARDAMPEGGQLTISTSASEIGRDLSGLHPEARPGQFVCLSVSDTGCGMAPEVLEHIFEPFYTTKEISKGTGLGLATVHGIVKQQLGWIEVSSQVGEGSTFKIFIPASAGPAPAKERTPSTPIRGGRETILAVEDEPALRELVRMVLQRYGYQVLEAKSGVEALQVWDQHAGKIDLLLTDMMMPEGIMGRKLAEQLLALKPALKVIYTSGYSPDVVGKEFNLLEGLNFLQKPYEPPLLVKAVRDCLDR